MYNKEESPRNILNQTLTTSNKEKSTMNRTTTGDRFNRKKSCKLKDHRSYS